MKEKISDQMEIMEVLSSLFEDYPISCKKTGGSGLVSNERIVVIMNNYFCYYKTFSSYQEHKPETLQEKYLKAKVEVSKIYEARVLPANAVKKKTIKLMIPYDKIFSTEAISKDGNSKNHLVQWEFDFNKSLNEHILARKAEIQKRKKKIISVKEISEKELEDGILKITKRQKSKVPEKSAEEELDERAEKLNDLKLFISFKEQKQQQEKERQKRFRDNAWKMKKRTEEDEKEMFPLYKEWTSYIKNFEQASKKCKEEMSQAKFNSQLTFIEEIFHFKELSTQLAVKYVDEKLVGWEAEQLQFQDFTFYQGVWIKIGGKQINQTFLVNYYLSDLLLHIGTYKNVRFRVPLMNFIKYKGFKVLILGNMPYSEKYEVYRATRSDQFDIDEVNMVSDALLFFSTVLGVKSQGFYIDKFRYKAPLGKDVRVFKAEGIRQNQKSFQKFYYITGVKGIFPVDYNYQIKMQNIDYCLRPQLISDYRDKIEDLGDENFTLLTQAFKVSHISQEEKKKQDEKVYEISTIHIYEKIMELMRKFNSLELILIDKYSIKQYFSAMGINIRYIGEFYKLSQVPYLEEVFRCEAVARTIKRIYKETVMDLYKNDSFFKRRLINKKQIDVVNGLIEEHNLKLKKSIIDFLNLIFGNDVQTRQFWEIISEKTLENYNIPVKYPPKIKSGQLLLSVLSHCGFLVRFELDIPLFQVQRPFSLDDWIDFNVQSKVFDFPSLGISKIIREIPLIEDSVQGEEYKYLFPLLKMELLFNYHINRDSFPLQVVLARMNNLGEGFEKPIHRISYHPSQLPHYFANKSHENFKKALDIMNFSLAENHPLFVSLYDTYSDIFENELLKKSSLLAAIQGLGQFHPKTTQLFSKYYHQGFKMFELKARRSKNLQSAFLIIQRLQQEEKAESCMLQCRQQMLLRDRTPFSNGKDLQLYFKILEYGIMSSIKCTHMKNAKIFIDQYSFLLNVYKIKNLDQHEFILRYGLITQLSFCEHKLYLYKLTLLVIKMQEDFNDQAHEDDKGFKLPRSPMEKLKIIQGIINEYYIYQTHQKWLNNILHNLVIAYNYFNFLVDLFTNYKHHINQYKHEGFKTSLGYFDLLVRIFGQRLFHQSLYEFQVGK